MSNSKRTAKLQKLVNSYSRQLGPSRPPRVRIVPGPSCSYTPIMHRVSIGEDVIAAASVDTCRVIIAHEVGHSHQKDLRQIRVQFWTMVVTCLSAIMLMSVSLLMGWYKNVAWSVCSSLLCWVPFIYLTLTKVSYSESEFENINREFDADDCAGRLVGYRAAYNALIEYGELFGGGYIDKSVQVRLEKLRNTAQAEARNGI